jgi:hypothetical protein
MTIAIEMMPAVDLDTGQLIDVPIDPDVRQHPRHEWQSATRSKRSRDRRYCRYADGGEAQLRRRWVEVEHYPDAAEPEIVLHFGGDETTTLEICGPVPPYALSEVISYIAGIARGGWWQFHRDYPEERIKSGMTFTWRAKHLAQIEAKR